MRLYLPHYNTRHSLWWCSSAKETTVRRYETLQCPTLSLSEFLKSIITKMVSKVHVYCYIVLLQSFIKRLRWGKWFSFLLEDFIRNRCATEILLASIWSVRYGFVAGGPSSYLKKRGGGCSSCSSFVFLLLKKCCLWGTKIKIAKIM